MRELKFRAWSEDLEKFVRVDYLDLLRKGFGIQYGQSSDSCKWEYPDEFIVNQFTGRFDKTGNPIYEGDIINHPYRGTYIVCWNTVQTEYQLRHIWHQLCTPFSEIDINENLCLTIMGNIHQNPELIK